MKLRWKLRTTFPAIAVVAAFLALIAMDLRRSGEIYPPDILGIEVPSADPVRPITGQRLVRADGTINMGYFGELKVAGLTPRELRSRLAAHLRQHPAGPRLADLDAEGVLVNVVRKNTARGFYARTMRDVFHSPNFGPG